MKNTTTFYHKIQPWIVWAIGSLYFLYDFMQQVAPSVMGQNIMSTFGISATMLGIIASVYFYSYGVLQIPIGVIIDKYGPRIPLTIAAFLSCLTNVWLAYSQSPFEALMAHLFLGAFCGFSFVTILKLISNWFPIKYFATMVGLTNVLGMLGAVFAENPLARLVNYFGWRHTVLIFALAGFILSILIFALIRNHSENYLVWSKKTQQKRSFKKSWQDFLLICRIKDSWINGLFAMLINTIYVAYGDLWGTPYLMRLYHINKAQAALIVSMMYVGSIPGGLFFGWISDYIGKRKKPMIYAALLGLIVMPLMIYIPNLPQWAMFTLFFILGISASGNLVAYAYAHDIRPQGSAGISEGFVNTWLIGGSAIFQPIIGVILATFDQKHYFTLLDYRYALSVMVLTMLLTLICALLIKETNCKSINY